MKKLIYLAFCLVLSPAIINAQDIEGSKDHPLFNRISGFTITEYLYEEFG